MQKITYDREANVAYVYFAPIAAGQVAETFELTDALNLDVDERGKVLGLEILDATSFFSELQSVFGGKLELPERIDRETFDPKTLWHHREVKV